MIDDPLIVPHVAAWRAWLDRNEYASDGVWLVLAKKGTIEPTSLRYAEALEEALCSGWIDGQKRSFDATTFLQRFTPRRSRSVWSQRNVGIVAELEEGGRMRDRGREEVERARADGRWGRAYPGAADAEVPADLLAAFEANPLIRVRFEALSASERYAQLFPLMTATPEQRPARLTRVLRKLAGE